MWRMPKHIEYHFAFKWQRKQYEITKYSNFVLSFWVFLKNYICFSSLAALLNNLKFIGNNNDANYIMIFDIVEFGKAHMLSTFLWLFIWKQYLNTTKGYK